MIDIKKTIIEKIEQYSNIALFFHELPDFDALGSVYGLQSFLRNKYPKKDIKIIGLDTLSIDFENQLFTLDKNHIPNKFLANSLGIIFDTANVNRIWSQRQNFCQELIAIDHHPNQEIVGDYEWKDSSYSATAEMIAEWLLEWDDTKLSIDTCNYLYAGLLTDTYRFLYPSVTPRTYRIVAKLMEHGCERKFVHDTIYLSKLNEVRFRNYLFNLAVFNQKEGYACLKIPKGAFERYNVKKMSYVNTIGSIKGIEIWASFYYDKDAKKWKGSLRSSRLPVDALAHKYRGGGHKLASGLTLEKESQIKNVIKDIKEYLKNQR